MSEFTPEELAEFAQLEADEKAAAEADAHAAKRMRLEAMRLRKALAAKHGRPGLDFQVVETTVGLFAIRRALDVEVDAFESAEDGRQSIHNFVTKLALYPAPEQMQKALGDHQSVGPTLVKAATELLKIQRGEEGKK
jgi:hypothetical protein